MYKEDDILVCKVGSTTLQYQWRCIADLHAMLKKHGDWMDLGGADEQKETKEGTVEAWARSANNPVKGLVWVKERASGKVWCICAPIDGSDGISRTYTRGKE